MAFNIFRPLDRSERQDMVPLGETDILDLFLKTVAEKKIEYQKQYIPFDTYSARMDFEIQLNKKMNEMNTIVDKSKINPAIEFGDLDTYADPSRFEYIGKDDAKETKLVHGIKTEIKIGTRYSFRGNQRGNRLTIFVPNEDEKIMEDFISKHYSQNDTKITKKEESTEQTEEKKEVKKKGGK